VGTWVENRVKCSRLYYEEAPKFRCLFHLYYFLFTGFSKKSTVLILTSGQQGGGSKLCRRFRMHRIQKYSPERFTFILCARFSALQFCRKILTNWLEFLVCYWEMVRIVPQQNFLKIGRVVLEISSIWGSCDAHEKWTLKFGARGYFSSLVRCIRLPLSNWG